MAAPQSDFLRILTERGFIHQCSDMQGLDALAAKGEVVAYVGYDCTAPSLHVGHLLSIMMLHWLQKTGAGKPITLMGGGTTRVGDPSGRDETRKILSIDDINANKDALKGVFAKLLTFGEGKTDAIMPDNAEWLTKLNYIEMLRDIGRHFSVNRMLTMDSVRMRLEREQELSFIEFNYMILQSYDFVELARRYGTNLQMGGSDQWGNIVTGVDLGRRMGTHQLYALTCPLLTTSSGAKMGKTAAGAVWLNADMLSNYDYWQFWRNTEDGDVARFLKLFTLLPMAEIDRLAALQGAEINEAKKVLATEATALVRGREAADAAAETAKKTFEQGALGDDLPVVTVPAAELSAGIGVLSLFVRAGLVGSNGEARRQVQGGGLKLNDEAVTDPQAVVTAAALKDGVAKLSFGRKKHVLVKLGLDDDDEVLLWPEDLRAGLAHRAGGVGCVLRARPHRLRLGRADQARLSRREPEGPGAGSRHRPRRPHRKRRDSRLRGAEPSGEEAGAARRPLRLRRDAGLQQLSRLHGACEPRPQAPRPSLGDGGELLPRHAPQGAGDHDGELPPHRKRLLPWPLGHGRGLFGGRRLPLHGDALARGRRCRRGAVSARRRSPEAHGRAPGRAARAGGGLIPQ